MTSFSWLMNAEGKPCAGCGDPIPTAAKVWSSKDRDYIPREVCRPCVEDKVSSGSTYPSHPFSLITAPISAAHVIVDGPRSDAPFIRTPPLAQQ